VIERSEQGADPAAANLTPPAAFADNPATGEARATQGWIPPVVPTASGSPSKRPDRDIPLGRQLAAGAAPINRSFAWMWLLFAALGFLGGQVLAALVVALAAAVSGNLHSLAAITKLSEPPTWYIVSTLIGLWAGFFGAAWVSSSAKGTKNLVQDIGLRFRWIDLLGLPIGFGGQVLVAIIYAPIAQHVSNFNQRFDAPSQRLTGSSHGTAYVVIALCTVIGAPFFEEVFFRGVLLRALARLFGTVGRWVGPALAIIITGVLFGLAHAESLQLLGLATFGIILSFVSYRTGRLGMNMVAHATFNLTALAAVVLPFTLGTRVFF
jgi:membrane protease YdiL (CAAX protease family)